MNIEGSAYLPSVEGSSGQQVWTYMLVEDRLVEAMQLWRKSPGGGHWPFAGDGPWHLIQAQAGDYDARGGDMTGEVSLRPLPLTTEQMRRRDEASEWIVRYVMEDDRALVGLVLGHMASGRRVPWLALRRDMGVKLGAGGLTRRYERSVAAICCGLNGWGKASVGRILQRRRLLGQAAG